MSSVERQARLDGFEIEIFRLVMEGATTKQWKEWLRVPLEHAAANGNMDLFTRLLDAGADGGPGWRGCYGRTLLGAAAYGKDENIVLSLLKTGASAEVNVLFNEENPSHAYDPGEDEERGPTSALLLAAKQGADGASRALMMAGADPNQLGVDDESPLHVAAQLGHHAVVNNLILKRANLEGKSPASEQTPLHCAADEGQVLCVSTLLLGGADKNSLDFLGRTPLALAVRGGHVKAAEELLAAGADLDIRSCGSSSVLDSAAESGQVEAFRLILRYGGDVRACDRDGLTPLHKIDVRADLLVPELLEAGADIEAECFAECSTPLFHAIRPPLRDIGAVRALLEGGANSNACDKNGSTPLHAACKESYLRAVELLLRWGADETRANDLEDKPFDMVGTWEADVTDWGYDRESNDERKADDQRIRQMLASAPADRSWRRRGWLVLCRSHPGRVQLATDDDSRCDRSTKVAKASVVDSGGETDVGEEEASDLGRLVERLVGLDADGVFRLVVGFL
eukprot:g9497.t1